MSTPAYKFGDRVMTPHGPGEVRTVHRYMDEIDGHGWRVGHMYTVRNVELRYCYEYFEIELYPLPPAPASPEEPR